jgi:hypothetical protein
MVGSIATTMNTHDFELMVSQHTPPLILRWILTADGLRLQWTPQATPVDDNILMLATPQARHVQSAVT